MLVSSSATPPSATSLGLDALGAPATVPLKELMNSLPTISWSSSGRSANLKGDCVDAFALVTLPELVRVSLWMDLEACAPMRVRDCFAQTVGDLG